MTASGRGLSQRSGFHSYASGPQISRLLLEAIIPTTTLVFFGTKISLISRPSKPLIGFDKDNMTSCFALNDAPVESSYLYTDCWLTFWRHARLVDTNEASLDKSRRDTAKKPARRKVVLHRIFLWPRVSPDELCLEHQDVSREGEKLSTRLPMSSLWQQTPAFWNRISCQIKLSTGKTPASRTIFGLSLHAQAACPLLRGPCCLVLQGIPN